MRREIWEALYCVRTESEQQADSKPCDAVKRFSCVPSDFYYRSKPAQLLDKHSEELVIG